jgi:hypothetical protein
MSKLVLCIFVAVTVQAQTDRGTVTGAVTDPTGSVAPGVEITARNEATGIESRTVSGPAGTYTLPLLPNGSYMLTAQMPGFKTYVRSKVPVQVAQTTRMDIVLEVGGVEERVTVTAEAPLLNTDTSDVGIVVNNEKFLDLPLTLGGDIRNASAFIFLSPGVSGNTWEKHIGGGGSFTDAVYYDGAVLSVAPNNDAQYNPSVDAIAEFKLVTNDYAAEFGHGLAGVTSFTLKSGTNALHGSAFEFFRNEKLDARGFFPLVKAPTRQNEFGGTLGGPIRKNQTFFFGSVDSFRRRQGLTRPLVTVPLPDFLRGDFSRWTQNIYDPATTTAAGSGFTRQPFPNRIIPQNRMSQISRNMAALYPAPTFPERLTNNYLATLASPMQDAHNWTLKIDHQINPAHKLFGTFIYTDRPAIKGSASLEGPVLSNNRQDLTSRFGRISEDWTISPTTINHFVASVDRIVDNNIALTHGQGWRDKLGLRGVEGDFFPRVEFNQGFVQLGHTTNYRVAINTFGFLDTLSLIRGKHAIKVGAEYLRHRNNDNALTNTGGTFSFSNLETALPGSSATGNAVASFLLGEVDSASARFYANETGARWSYLAAFVQDDYKVTNKLTLNLGLRWALQTPFSDVLDRMSYMDPFLPNPGAGNRPGAYSFIGSGAGRNGLERLSDVRAKDFGPRVGFAYNMAKDWVVRGGYGIFYWSVNSQGIGIPADGFNVTASFASADTGITPAFNWDNGFPQNFTKPPIITPTVQNGLNATVSLRSRGGVWPYSQQWNLTLERQIGKTASIRAAYIGIKGSRLHAQDATNWNQVDPRYLSLGSLLNAQITSPQAQAAGFAPPFPEFVDLWGRRATVAQALRPFPQYNSVGQAAATYGNSNYHSLQVYGQKRMSRGFDFTVAYTFSKMIDDTRSFSTGVGQQNYYDRRAERAISVFDQPHILAISYIYELPFGPGRAHLSGLGGLGRRIVGGWNLSGIHRYTSGVPQSLSVTNTLPIFNGTLRPNSAPGVAPRGQEGPGGFDPNRDRWIDPAAFSAPPAFTFGNTSRYLSWLRGPASLSESFAILKDTPIREQINLQFRTEISNPFNRVVFSDPQTNFSNANFGQIGSQANTPRVIQLGLKLIW